MTSEELKEIFGDPVSVYTKQDAVNDGFQIDVSEWNVTKKLFKVPVYLTTGVWLLVSYRPTDEHGEEIGDEQLSGIKLTSLLTQVFQVVKNKMIPENETFGTLDFSYIHKANNQRTTQKIYIVFHPAEGFTIMLPEDY